MELSCKICNVNSTQQKFLKGINGFIAHLREEHDLQFKFVKGVGRETIVDLCVSRKPFEPIEVAKLEDQADDAPEGMYI